MPDQSPAEELPVSEIRVSFGRIDPEDAVLSPAARYRVTWTDCCTNGEFTAALVSVNESEDQIDSVTFDNGVTCDGVTLVPA